MADEYSYSRREWDGMMVMGGCLAEDLTGRQTTIEQLRFWRSSELVLELKPKLKLKLDLDPWSLEQCLRSAYP